MLKAPRLEFYEVRFHFTLQVLVVVGEQAPSLHTKSPQVEAPRLHPNWLLANHRGANVQSESCRLPTRNSNMLKAPRQSPQIF